MRQKTRKNNKKNHWKKRKKVVILGAEASREEGLCSKNDIITNNFRHGYEIRNENPSRLRTVTGRKYGYGTESRNGNMVR